MKHVGTRSDTKDVVSQEQIGSGAIPLGSLSISGASTGYVPTFNGSAIVWAPVSGGGSGISHATSDGRKWASKDGAWEPIPTYYSSSTQPTVPSGNRVPGDKWLNLATGEELTWVWDGNTGQWVNFHGGPAVAGGGAGIDFPSPTTGLQYTYNGVTYVFDGLAWQIPGGGAGAYYENPIDRPPTTPNAWDDEFEGTSLDAAWTEYLPVSPAGYGGLVADGAYTVYASAPDTGGRFAGIHKATAGTGTYIVCLEHTGLISQYRGLFFGLSNAASSAYYFGIAIVDNSASGVNTVYTMTASNVTTAGATVAGSTVLNLNLTDRRLYVKFEVDATDVIISVSTNGRYFTPIQTVAISAYLGDVGRLWIGMHRYASGATPYAASVLWARKTA